MITEKSIPEYREIPSHIRRFAINLEANGMEWNEVLNLIESSRGITDQNKVAVGKWFIENLKVAEQKFNKETFKKIREGCACCKGGLRNKSAKEICNSADNFKDRLKLLSECKLLIGDHIEIIDDNTFDVHFAPDGYELYRCSCMGYDLKDLPGIFPETYCYCCGGHIKLHSETALGVKLNEELISSPLTTGMKKSCVFRLTVVK